MNILFLNKTYVLKILFHFFKNKYFLLFRS